MRVAGGKFEIHVTGVCHLPPLQHLAQNFSSRLFVAQKNTLPLRHFRTQTHHRAVAEDDRRLGRLRKYLALLRSLDVLRPLYRYRDFPHVRVIVSCRISHGSSHHRMEFAALPLCPRRPWTSDCCQLPVALRARRSHVRPLRLAPAMPKWSRPPPSTAIAGKYQCYPLLPSPPPVTGFLATYRRTTVYQFDTLPPFPPHNPSDPAEIWPVTSSSGAARGLRSSRT